MLGCSSNGLTRNVQVLKEAGVTVKRSKWDFARDGTSFLVKVNISDVCLDKNKTRVIC